MDKLQAVFGKVKEIIVKELNVKPEQVTMDAGFAEEFGADSLDALELFNQVESEFLITIDYDSESKMKYVKDLFHYLSEHVSDKYFE